MTVFEISKNVKMLHEANTDETANYIANQEGEIIQVERLDEFIESDCYCFSCRKLANKEVEIKLV